MPIIAVALLAVTFCFAAGSPAAEPAAPAPNKRSAVPEKLVVLTFDDSAKSHFTNVRPILKQYGFGATFFITEGFDFRDNKRDYMTWEEIAQLHRDGFEIGNHSRDHLGVNAKNVDKYGEQLEAIAKRCAEHGIPAPVSFAYPGNAIDRGALAVLKQAGIKWARRGGSPEYAYEAGKGVAYEPGLDHPLLIPTTGDARPKWQIEDFQRAVQMATQGRIAVLQFHGVPDTAHSWVSSSEDLFKSCMNYLAVNGYRVIAMRDLEKFVDPQVAPQDAWGPIEDRRKRIAADRPLTEFRAPRNDDDLAQWVEIMRRHGYSPSEMSAATGAPADKLKQLAESQTTNRPAPAGPSSQLLVLPYPGGRHPRIGFRDGAIRPQRETKVSVFAPWQDGGYAVVDVPEAIWMGQGTDRKLLYLAHTHVPTIWDQQQKSLEPLEWTRGVDGDPTRLRVERTLPNQVRFGAEVVAEKDRVRMELWLTNGSTEKLTGLVVQNCVMLAGLPGFETQNEQHKRFRSPMAAVGNATGDRWVVTAWERCVRPWANPPCPCVHSDPQFSDCEPGQTQRLRGWILFHEGADIDARLVKEVIRNEK